MKTETISNCCGAKTYSPDNESHTCMECKEPCQAVELPEDDFEDWDDFQECSRCDGHEACRDHGCAFELGLGHMVKSTNDF